MSEFYRFRAQLIILHRPPFSMPIELQVVVIKAMAGVRPNPSFHLTSEKPLETVKKQNLLDTQTA